MLYTHFVTLFTLLVYYRTMNRNDTFSLAIHGGAGLITERHEYEAALKDILAQGGRLLRGGSSALDVVEVCVMLLEDNPLFNAGRGSVLNEHGKVELDASIMNGVDMSAGAVAAVSNIKNPINLARQAMEKSRHVFLVGSGAMEFAKTVNACMESDEYFVVDARVRQWEKAKKDEKIVLDHSSEGDSGENKLGTVGAVALDRHGNLAAATSTGGLVNKKFGRVGDSPVIGAGVFADNETCAVSCTGIGEHILRTSLAKSVSDHMLIGNTDVQLASRIAIERFAKKVGGLGGFVAVGKNGVVACEFTTPQMIYGFTTHKQGIWVQFDKGT